MLSNNGAEKSVKWPERRCAHSSALISNSKESHLLVVGGAGTFDCWLFDISKRIWKQPVSVRIT